MRCLYEYTFLEDGSTLLTSYSNIFLRGHLKCKNVIMTYLDIPKMSSLLILNNNYLLM